MKRIPIQLLLAAVAIAAFVAGAFLESQRTPASLPLLEGKQSSARLAAVLHISDPNERAIEIASFFRYQASAHDAAELRRVLDDERLFVDEVAEILFASWWAGHEPAVALKSPFVAPYGGREPWLRSIIAEWTRRDPQGAIAAVSESIPADARPAAIRSLLVTWFEGEREDDPKALLDLFPALGNDARARGEAVDLILRSMIETRGVEPTIDFAESVPAGSKIELRREFLGRLAGRIAIGDSARALELVDEHAHGAYQLVMHRYFATQWGYHDGEAAVSWAAALPPETDGQSGTVLRAWRSWVKRDRQSAQYWMRQQEPSVGLEPAYSRYVGGIARSDPDGALELLRNVKGDEARRTILTNVGIGFFQRDPILGTAWMEAEALPEDMKATILDRVAKLRGARSMGS